MSIAKKFVQKYLEGQTTWGYDFQDPAELVWTDTFIEVSVVDLYNQDGKRYILVYNVNVSTYLIGKFLCPEEYEDFKAIMDAMKVLSAA